MSGRVAALVLGALAGVTNAGPTLDWPQWRGPARTGIAAGPVAARWPAGSLVRAWSVEVGEGHSGPVVSGSRVYVHARVGGDEVISALDLAAPRGGAERGTGQGRPHPRAVAGAVIAILKSGSPLRH